MAEFKRPFEIKQGPTKEEALASTLGPAIQSLPLLYMQAKRAKMEERLRLKELEMKEREFDSKFGTGAPLPTTINELPGMAPTPQEAIAGNDPITPLPQAAQPTPQEILSARGTSGLDALGKVAEVKKATAETTDKAVGQQKGLRDTFLSESKDFKMTRDAMQRIRDSASDPSGAGDLALIFNFMKTLDPGSTVREGEFANAQNSAGIDERTRGLYNRIVDGERLSDNQRKDFVVRAEKLYGGQEKIHKKRIAEFRRVAEKDGLDPDQVIVDLALDAMEGGGRGQPDESGFTVGQSYKMKDGTMAIYRGGGKFEGQ